MRVAFLDRDGTIVSDYSDELWSNVQSPDFLRGSIEALRNIQNKGYSIFIITNQYIINEGFINDDQYNSFNNKMLGTLSEEKIKIERVYYCPHARNENCSSTKPNPGMIERALKEYPSIEIDKSFLVGDSIADSKLAKHFNLKFFGIQQGGQYGYGEQVDSLYEASLLI